MNIPGVSGFPGGLMPDEGGVEAMLDWRLPGNKNII